MAGERVAEVIVGCCAMCTKLGCDVAESLVILTIDFLFALCYTIGRTESSSYFSPFLTRPDRHPYGRVLIIGESL